MFDVFIYLSNYEIYKFMVYDVCSIFLEIVMHSYIKFDIMEHTLRYVTLL